MLLEVIRKDLRNSDLGEDQAFIIGSIRYQKDAFWGRQEPLFQLNNAILSLKTPVLVNLGDQITVSGFKTE